MCIMKIRAVVGDASAGTDCTLAERQLNCVVVLVAFLFMKTKIQFICYFMFHNAAMLGCARIRSMLQHGRRAQQPCW